MGRNEGSRNMSITVRRLIAEAAVTNPKKPRRALAIELQNLIERMGEVVPSEETIEKLISQARNHDPHPQDNPWSLVSVEQYPNLFSPEALPSVLQAWVYVREHLKCSFTIRQAKWVARLYAVIKDIPNLISKALCYAQIELIASIIPGGEIETSGADLSIFELMTGEEVSVERRCQILGIDKKRFESMAELMTGKKFSLESIEPKPRIQHKLKPEEMTNWGNRDWQEKIIEAHSLIMREIKSEEDWLKRIPKLKKLFNELGLEVPEKYKEAHHERSYSQEV